jgi:hypothetical protein
MRSNTSKVSRSSPNYGPIGISETMRTNQHEAARPLRGSCGREGVRSAIGDEGNENEDGGARMVKG